MRTKRWMATCVVALLSVAAVLAKDIRVVVFKVSQMHCENCEKKIRAAFEALPGVKEVTASHETGVAEVFLEAGVPEKTKGMYEKALSGIEGYEVTGVEE